ncbi:MAG: lipopolysaccharide biosynthesis protein, partial [Brucella intermedia]
MRQISVDVLGTLCFSGLRENGAYAAPSEIQQKALRFTTVRTGPKIRYENLKRHWSTLLSYAASSGSLFVEFLMV